MTHNSEPRTKQRPDPNRFEALWDAEFDSFGRREKQHFQPLNLTYRTLNPKPFE